MLQFITLFSLALAVVQGLVVPDNEKRDGPAPLALDFSIKTSVGNFSVSEWRAQQTSQNTTRFYPEAINNVNYGYFLNVYLGSEGQKNNVLLDTGSSDLWVPADYYDHSSSYSSVDIGETFAINYVDGSSATGNYYLDTLTFDTGLPNITNFQFAAADSPNFGVFGIADRYQEVAQKKYDNFPWALQKAGLIPKASYSLYLGQAEGTGVVIFGGIDTEKFEGNLTKYPFATKRLSLDVQSITVAGQQIPDGSAYVLDSGSALALVTPNVLNALNKVFNVSNGLVNCNQPSNEYISFNFGQNTVKIPYSDAVFNNGDGTCSLAFSVQEGYTILGDIFLRNAYVYYDLTDHTISLAQVKYSLESNIIVA